MGRSRSGIKPEFAEWMRSHLGYQVSETNVPVGKTPKRTPVVGIRGETYGILWYRLRIVAFVIFAAAVALRTIIHVPDGEVPVGPNSLLCFAIVVYVVAHIGRVRTRQYAWVECRDLKRPVSCEDVRVLNDVVQNVRASEASSWKPAQVLLVAGAKGFEGDALSFARSLGVECYYRTDSGFEQTT